MTENKTTVQNYMDWFALGDHEKILSCLTEDVSWYVPGAFDIKGKEAFAKEITNDNFEGLPIIQITRMIEENDIVVAEGKVQCKVKNGEWINLLICDVFHMRDGKIKHLTSYLMNV